MEPKCLDFTRNTPQLNPVICLHRYFITEKRGFRLDKHHSECRTCQNTYYANEHTASGFYTKTHKLGLNTSELLVLITFEKKTTHFDILSKATKASR